MGAYLLLLPFAATAKIYNRAEVTRIERAGQVFIDDTKVNLKKTNNNPIVNKARINSVIRTRKSTADVKFEERTIGYMDKETPILIGATCLDLRPGGKIFLSGDKCVFIGNNKKKNTKPSSSYELMRDVDGIYTLSVGAGQVVIEEYSQSSLAGSTNDETVDSNLTPYSYPKVNASIGTGISGDTFVFPSTDGLILGQVNAFVPLSQSEASKILYSYTSASSNFDGYLGISTEVGYRWFTSSNQSATGFYLGISGFDTPSCFNTLVNVGVGYDVSRWRFGASTGLKVAGCDAGFSYAGLNISLPIAKLGEQRSLYLSLSPYAIWGPNIISPGSIYQSGISSTLSPGGKVTLNAPLSESLTLKAYSAVDTVYGVSIGSSLVYRIPTGRGFIDDPNTGHSPTSSAPLSSGIPKHEISGYSNNKLSLNGLTDIGAQSSNHLNQDSFTLLASNDGLKGLTTQLSLPGSPIVIKEGQQAKFTADGELIGNIVNMKPIEINQMMLRSLMGRPLLPESRRLAKAAARFGALTTQLAQVTGLYFMEASGLPVSETVDTPFGTSRFPTAAYSCASSEEGLRYAEAKLREEGNVDAANQVRDTGEAYLGKGDKVANGWTVTAFASNAYVSGNGALCEEINSIIRDDSDYYGPPNPLKRIDFK